MEHLCAQLKVKFDMSKKVAEGFTKFYETDLEGKIDKLAYEGTAEIFDQVINK